MRDFPIVSCGSIFLKSAVGNERAIEPLVALLIQDENTLVRARAVSALGMLGQLGSVAPLSVPLRIEILSYAGWP